MTKSATIFDTGSGRTRLLRTLERQGWIWLTVAVAASLLAGGMRVATGLAVGGTLSLLNFRWLCFFYQDLLPRRGHRIRLISSLGYVVRYIVLGIILYLAILSNILNILALIAGLSVMVAIIPIVGLWSFRCSPLGQFEVR